MCVCEEISKNCCHRKFPRPKLTAKFVLKKRIPVLPPLTSFKNINLSVMSTYIALLSPDMNQLCIQQSLQCG